CIQVHPRFVVLRASRIDHGRHVEARDERQVPTDLLGDDMTIGIRVANDQHLALHGAHPSDSASADETTNATFAFARTSSTPPSEVRRPSTDLSHMFCAASDVGSTSST